MSAAAASTPQFSQASSKLPPKYPRAAASAMSTTHGQKSARPWERTRATTASGCTDGAAPVEGGNDPAWDMPLF